MHTPHWTREHLGQRAIVLQLPASTRDHGGAKESTQVSSAEESMADAPIVGGGTTAFPSGGSVGTVGSDARNQVGWSVTTRVWDAVRSFSAGNKLPVP